MSDDVSPAYVRFQKQPADTRYVCGECKLPTSKNQVLGPPLLKGSNVVICRSCGSRPRCQTCCAPGTLDREAPELQPGHSMAQETSLLVPAIHAGVPGVVCRDCLHYLQKAGLDIREA